MVGAFREVGEKQRWEKNNRCKSELSVGIFQRNKQQQHPKTPTYHRTH